MDDPQIDYTRGMSSLLVMPIQDHKTFRLKTTKGVYLTTKAHRGVVKEPELHAHKLRLHKVLRNFRLENVAKVEWVSVDRAIISALVERFRPETCTFHLPTGEVTVTLQDIACLWGLPITGIPVTGFVDRDWNALFETFFGAGTSGYAFKKSGANCVRFPWLRRVYGDGIISAKSNLSKDVQQKTLNEDSSDAEVDEFIRAYVLSLFGSILFPDSTGETISCMYLPYLEDLESSKSWNWGAAVLALLFRSLSEAVKFEGHTIYGPLILLVHWSWAHIAILRPISRANRSTGDPFACQWKEKTWSDNVHNMAFTLIRQEFENLDMTNTDQFEWNPYEAVMHTLPPIVEAERCFWGKRTWLIYYWVVEPYYPERVMRQFGRRQVIPNDPHDWMTLKGLREDIKRSKDAKQREPVNWSIRHARYIKESRQEDSLVLDDQPAEDTNTDEYLAWYFRMGMPSVYLNKWAALQKNGPQNLVQLPKEVAKEEITPTTDTRSREITRWLMMALHTLKCYKRKGSRKSSKWSLNCCFLGLKDWNAEHRIAEMLSLHNLPRDIDQLPSDEDVDLPCGDLERSADIPCVTQVEIDALETGDFWLPEWFARWQSTEHTSGEGTNGMQQSTEQTLGDGKSGMQQSTKDASGEETTGMQQSTEQTSGDGKSGMQQSTEHVSGEGTTVMLQSTEQRSGDGKSGTQQSTDHTLGEGSSGMQQSTEHTSCYPINLNMAMTVIASEITASQMVPRAAASNPPQTGIPRGRKIKKRKT